MPISIDGTGSITGLSAGGLPDSSITADELASDAVTTAKVNNAAITTAKLAQPLTLATAQNSTSGTAIDFTGIPSWVKRITVIFNGVSTNGSSSLLIQGGNSGGIVNTGYVSTSNHLNNSSGSSGSNSTAGFIFFSNNPAFLHSGIVTLCNISGSIWVCSISGKSDTAHVVFGGGNGAISSLDRVRITTVNGSDAFDAGSINVLYEG